MVGLGDEARRSRTRTSRRLRPFVLRHLEIDIDRASSRAGRVRRRCASRRRRLPDGLRGRWRPRSAPSTSRPRRWIASSTRAARACATSSASARGELGRLPDVVVRPGERGRRSRRSWRAALAADAVVIPFGGGSNISGSLEAPADEARPVVSVDIGRLDRVLVDRRRSRALARGAGRRVRPATSRSSSTRRAGRSGTSPTASPTRRSAAGSRPARRACSPTSTATSPTSRAGCASSRRPACSSIRPVPTTSTGPSVREMMLGSEGRLGIITEATVHVHRAAGRAHDPRLPLPDLVRRARRDARDRRRRGVAVGDARVRPAGDAVLVRDQEAPTLARRR